MAAACLAVAGCTEDALTNGFTVSYGYLFVEITMRDPLVTFGTVGAGILIGEAVE